LHSIFLQRVREKGLELNLIKELPNDIRILTDETKIIQIITNLLNNAIKFTHHGKIELGYTIKGDKIEFFVRDTGIGIPKNSQDLIFERFRQADHSISTNYGGTGLGLSISKAFTAMLDGTIRVESEPNVGSTFTLSIPFITEAPNQTENKSLTLNVPDQKIAILVAEDEINNFKLIEAYLINTNYKLFHAFNGEEAIEKCRENKEIDLILMDIKMPKLDGVAAMLEIKKFMFNVPIIAQTAYALEHDKEELIEKGFDDYIAKPLDRVELLNLIKKYIS
jgi:CheY-like chemotaxis protein/anti-sigma regulatory factor (Ser/Thr protein kinase)